MGDSLIAPSATHGVFYTMFDSCCFCSQKQLVGYAGNQETTHFQTHRTHVTGRFTYIYHKNQPFM